MKRFLILLCGALVVAGCSLNRFDSDFTFANKLARDGLWNEAVFRWQRTLQQDPGNAAARNNLGVALENLGRFEEAEREYRAALELDPTNSYIQSNLKQVRQFLQRDDAEKDDGKKDEKKDS